MKFYTILFILYIITGCRGNNSNMTEPKLDKVVADEKNKELYGTAQIDTIILGDIDNDNKLDSAFIYTPPTILEIDKNGDTLFTMGCKDNNCFNKITFSSKIPKINIENSVWGQLESIDDINEDEVKEILFATNWFTTTRSNLYLFSLKNGKWNQLAKVSFRNRENSSLKKQFLKKNHKYYLIGTKLNDGDETEFLKEIEME